MLVPPRDPTSVADAIAALLREPTRRRLLGEYNLARQLAEFDHGVTVRRTEDLYIDLYRRTARARREHWSG